MLLCCVAALAHQNDFDVCWAKGSVAELIFTPLVLLPISLSLSGWPSHKS